MNCTLKLKNAKFFILVLLFICTSLTVFAQSETDSQIIDKKEQAKFNLIVKDKDNNFVNSLSKDDISIFIDGKEQTDFTIEKETLPLLYMLSIDNSGSMRFHWKDIKDSAKTIIGQNQSNDLMALMRFVSADKIQTTENFSLEKEYLFKNLDLFGIERGPTALIDAIY